MGWRGWAGGSRAGARGKTYFCATRSEGQGGEGGRVAATPLAGSNLRLGQPAGHVVDSLSLAAALRCDCHTGGSRRVCASPLHANARFSFCCVYQGGSARDTTHARPAIVTHSKGQSRPCRAYGGRDVPVFKTHGGRLPKERRHGAISTPPPRRFAHLALQIELRQPKDRRSSPASFETAGLAAPSLKPPDRWRIKGWQILGAATTDFLWLPAQ